MAYVWEFTNQRKLGKKEFIDYIEKKVFRTIRKYNLLPKNRIIKLKKSNDLHTKILISILSRKFKTEFSTKPNFDSMNLSSAAEATFQNILKGKFEGPRPNDRLAHPLYYHSDAELSLYAKLTNTKGTTPKRNKKIQELFKKFLKKNQDLEINVVKALSQLS